MIQNFMTMFALKTLSWRSRAIGYWFVVPGTLPVA